MGEGTVRREDILQSDVRANDVLTTVVRLHHSYNSVNRYYDIFVTSSRACLYFFRLFASVATVKAQ